MTAIPVISSILSPAGIAAFVGETYVLENTEGKLIKAGINHTYRINSHEKTFVFRIYSYNWRSKEEIGEELNLLLHLKDKGISVSSPIEDPSGGFVQTITAPEGKRFAVLFLYAPGHKIQNYSSEAHFTVGRTMAEIHRLTNGMQLKRVTYDANVLLNTSLERIRAFLPDSTEEMQFLMATKTALEKELSASNQALLRKGVVHLDIWFDNLNITDRDEVTLFDFDFCGNGWLCLDIAYYILQLHQTEKEETERIKKMQAFYAGYESIQTISAEEKKLVPALGICLYYFYLGVQCQRFDNWSNTFLNENYLKRFTSILIKGYYNIHRGSLL